MGVDAGTCRVEVCPQYRMKLCNMCVGSHRHVCRSCEYPVVNGLSRERMAARIWSILRTGGGLAESIQAAIALSGVRMHADDDEEEEVNPWQNIGDREITASIMHSVTMQSCAKTLYNDREVRGSSLKDQLTLRVCVVCGIVLKLPKTMTFLMCTSSGCPLYGRCTCWSCAQAIFATRRGEPIQVCFF